MSFSFPYQYADVSGIGRIFYPFVTIQVKTLWGWQSFDFLVDTGADITMLPSFSFGLLGLEKKDIPIVKTQGIGGEMMDTWATAIEIKIGRKRHTISAVISSDANTPPLLGKKDIFDDAYSLFLDSEKKETVLLRKK